MRAWEKTSKLMKLLISRGISTNMEQAETLRRAELTLRRWHEQECGDGNNWGSWAIERDEETGKPYMVTYPHKGGTIRRPIPDREAGAIRRIKNVCADLGLHFYVQTDPRGCALYVDNKLIPDNNYTQAVACSVY